MIGRTPRGQVLTKLQPCLQKEIDSPSTREQVPPVVYDRSALRQDRDDSDLTQQLSQIYLPTLYQSLKDTMTSRSNSN